MQVQNEISNFFFTFLQHFFPNIKFKLTAEQHERGKHFRMNKIESEEVAQLENK